MIQITSVSPVTNRSETYAPLLCPWTSIFRQFPFRNTCTLKEKKFLHGRTFMLQLVLLVPFDSGKVKKFSSLAGGKACQALAMEMIQEVFEDNFGIHVFSYFFS